MKKTFLMKLLVLMLSLCSVLFVFTACGGDDEGDVTEQPVCEHEWVMDEDKTVYATAKETGTAAYLCEKCNGTKTETMDNFTFLNGIESLATESYGLKITNLYFVETYNTHNDGFSADIIELLINVDSEGNLTGEGQAVVELLIDNETVNLETKACVNNDGVYVYFDASVSETFTGAMGTYLKIPFNALMVGASSEMGNPMGMPLEDFIDMYVNDIWPKSFEILDEGLISKFESNAAFKKVYGKSNYELNDAIGRLINRFFTAETKDGLTTYTLSVEKFKQFNDYLYETKLETVINKMFGKDTFANLESGILGLFDLTIGEIITEAESYGVTILELVEVYDELGLELTQILKDNGVSISNYPGLEAMLQSFIGPEFDIEETLKNDEFLNTTIGDIIDAILAAEADGLPEGEELIFTSVAELKPMISAGFAFLKELTVYDLISGEEDKQDDKEEVDEYIELIGSYGSITFTVDGEGILKQFDISVDYAHSETADGNTYGGELGGTVSFINGLTVESDADEIVAEYEALEDLLVFELDKVSHVTELSCGIEDQWGFNYTLDGKLLNIEITEFNWTGDVGYGITTTQIDIDFDKMLTLIQKDCGDYIYVALEAFGAKEIYREYYGGNLSSSHESTTVYDLYVSYNTATGEAVFYNANRGIISKHEVDANGVCGNCGEQIVDFNN